MNPKTLAGGLIAIGLGAAVYVAASGTTPAQKPADEDAPTPEVRETPTEPVVESVQKPPPEPEPPKRGIPVVGAKGVAWLEASIERHPRPGALVRIKADGTVRGQIRHWEAHVEAAAWIALEALSPEAPDAGARIEVSVGSTVARADHLLPLVVAIVMALQDRPYPSEILLAGVVAPDLGIAALEPEERYQRLADREGLKYVRGADLRHLLGRKLKLLPPSTRPKPPKDLGAPPDLHAIDLERARHGLRTVLGALRGGRPIDLPPPEDWREVSAKAEGALLAAKVKTPDELITLAVAAARIREGMRLMRWSTERLKPFGARIVRSLGPRKRGDAASLEDWDASWMVNLVMARTEGERLVRQWLPEVPGAKTRRPREQRVDPEALRERANRVRGAAMAFESVTLAHIRSLPRPWPRHDRRNMAFGRGEAQTRSPAADWGVAVEYLNRSWSQMVQALVLKPERIVSSSDPDAARVVRDNDRLTRLISTARKRAVRGWDIAYDREGGLLTEVRRLLNHVPREPKTDADKLRALEHLWFCGILSREAKRVAPLVVSGRRGGSGAGVPR